MNSFSKTMLLAALLILVILLGACASSPIATDRAEVSAFGPAHVLEGEGERDQTVVWGGQIVAVDNHPDRTELEIVSYPLDRADRPRISTEGGVRFVAVHEGFLEPMNYGPGRFVTILGQTAGIEVRPVGDYNYSHPVLLVEQLHLWPADPNQWQQSRPRFNIGVGIRL